jgi:hypothetical protein
MVGAARQNTANPSLTTHLHARLANNQPFFPQCQFPATRPAIATATRHEAAHGGSDRRSALEPSTPHSAANAKAVADDA